jgi:hypothetical protein
MNSSFLAFVLVISAVIPPVVCAVPYYGTWADTVVRSGPLHDTINFILGAPDGRYFDAENFGNGITVTFGSNPITNIELPGPFDPLVRAVVITDSNPGRIDFYEYFNNNLSGSGNANGLIGEMNNAIRSDTIDKYVLRNPPWLRPSGFAAAFLLRYDAQQTTLPDPNRNQLYIGMLGSTAHFDAVFEILPTAPHDVPEPTTLALMSIGLVGMGRSMRKGRAA